MSALQSLIIFSNCVGFQSRSVDEKPCRLHIFHVGSKNLSIKSHVGSTDFLAKKPPGDRRLVLFVQKNIKLTILIFEILQ